jgi:hypothetical protein
MAELRAAVYVDDPNEVGKSVLFVPGDEVPDWAAALITNPNCWVDGELPTTKAAAEPAADDAPPRAGKGSGRSEWAAYAESVGVTVDEDATRDEIIAAVDAAE